MKIVLTEEEQIFADKLQAEKDKPRDLTSQEVASFDDVNAVFDYAESCAINFEDLAFIAEATAERIRDLSDDEFQELLYT